MKRHGREFTSLGRILLHEPKAFPGALVDVFRCSIRGLWHARGGGFYACGYVITFVWLEITMLVEDVITAQSAGAFLGEQVVEMLFRYLGESFQNMIIAFIWPVFVIRFSPEWGIAFLGVAYLVFAKLLKQRLETWLFHDDEGRRDSAAAPVGTEDKS